MLSALAISSEYKNLFCLSRPSFVQMTSCIKIKYSEQYFIILNYYQLQLQINQGDKIIYVHLYLWNREKYKNKSIITNLYGKQIKHYKRIEFGGHSVCSFFFKYTHKNALQLVIACTKVHVYIEEEFVRYIWRLSSSLARYQLMWYVCVCVHTASS